MNYGHGYGHGYGQDTDTHTVTVMVMDTAATAMTENIKQFIMNIILGE